MEVQSPYNRICISHNREGHRAFAVFLLSFFVGKCRRAVSGVRCRSPPLHLDFYISKIQIGGISGEIRTKKSIYQRKRRLCGTVLYGFLPPQASRQGIYGQAVYEKSQGVRDFLSLIRNYQGLKELDATIINALIDKILVSEREKLVNTDVCINVMEVFSNERNTNVEDWVVID